MRYFMVLVFLIGAQVGFAEDKFDHEVMQILKNHFAQYKDKEYFSGISLTIKLPTNLRNYGVGRHSHRANSKPITSSSLFQIGSITKSFTSAIILQLEQEKKLSLNDPLKKWLPQYPKWGDITLRQLLNMTSGLPDYVDRLTQAIITQPAKIWKNAELAGAIYPSGQFSPPLKKLYYYTNTGYALLGMVIEKVTHHSYAEELKTRILEKIPLTQSFYLFTPLPQALLMRMAHVYGFNPYDVMNLLGQDLTSINMSWGGPAGGIIATTEDITKWVEALFVGKLLTAEKKAELKQLISVATSKPLKQTSATDIKGFGLGVAQVFTPLMGRFWFYEGETLGHRAFFFYKPCNKIILAFAFNSSTESSENDHGVELLDKIYRLILKRYPAYVCK